MVMIRRLIFIMVLLGLAFVFYRFLNPQWADSLIARLRWVTAISNIKDLQDQNTISTWSISSWVLLTWAAIQTWIISTWTVQTWTVKTWAIKTWSIKTWLVQTWFKSSWETIWLVDNMSGFSELIDPTAATKVIKWNLNYKDSDYNFSISFPWSWDGYTMQINTWKDIKSEFIFSFDKKDYFILYVIANNYYDTNKSSEFNYLTYLAKDSNNTFAYKILETSDTKSKAIPYILKTFKLSNPIVNISSPPIIAPTTVKVITTPSTVKKPIKSDWNYIKNIFDSFVK